MNCWDAVAERVPTRCFAAGALAVLVLAALAPAPAGAVDRSCGWEGQASPDKVNAGAPEQNGSYWAADLPIPPGGSVEVHGDFPHARYLSFVTYTRSTKLIDHLYDSQIVPDPGSTNPSEAGADRTASDRGYTIHVVDRPMPDSGREPNTLYNRAPEANDSNGLTTLLMRIYIVDRGQDLTGGVGVPALTLVGADGQRTTLPDCPDKLPDLTGVTTTEANAGLKQGYPHTGQFGSNPPRWRKFTNLLSAIGQSHLDNENTGSNVWPAVSPGTDQAFGSGGGFANPDNDYLWGFVSSEHGEVLMIHGKAPTTPLTYDGGATMGTGQVRYWSMCSNDATTTQFLGCVFDERVPLDADGRYTIAVSTTAARPVNATESCGVAWIPWGATNENLLIFRNVLSDPAFRESVQAARTDHEQEDMDDYYPDMKYFASSEKFSHEVGCRRPSPDPAPARATQRCTLVIRLPHRRGERVRRAVARVNGRRVAVRTGRRLRHLRPSDLRPGRQTIRLRLRTSRGKRTLVVRRRVRC